jgi:8-oxo-dGTP diphosphatase
MALVARYRVAMTTDLVVFALVGSLLHLLLIQRGQEPFKGRWALPGGFLERGETLEKCARRELREEARLELRHLRQLGTFSEPGRDPRGRVISVAYLALVRTGLSEISPGGDARDARWFPVDEAPKCLAFDHARMVELARRHLAALLYAEAAVLSLLPDSFTLAQAQGVYEVLSPEPLDKRNFRTWLQRSPFIEDTAKLRRGAHRPARLYRVRGNWGVDESA